MDDLGKCGAGAVGVERGVQTYVSTRCLRPTPTRVIPKRRLGRSFPLPSTAGCQLVDTAFLSGTLVHEQQQ